MQKLSPIYLIFLLSFVISHGVPGIIPLLPIFKEHFGLNVAQTSNAMAYFSYAAFLATPVCGYLYSKLPKRLFITILLCCFFLGALGTVLAPNFQIFLYCRIFQGIGSGGLQILMTILPSQFYKGSERASVMGKAFASCAVGLTVLPTISGFIGHYSWKLALMILQIPTIVTLIILYCTCLKPKFEIEKTKLTFTQVRKILLSPESLALLLALFCFGGLDMAMPSLFSLYSSEQFGFTTGTIGSIYALGNIGMTIGSTYLLSRMVKSTNFAYLYLAFGCVILCIYAFYTKIPSFAFYGVFFVYFMLSGLSIPFANYSISTITPNSMMIIGLTISMACFRGGQGIVTAIFANVKVAVGFEKTFWAMGLLYALIIALVFSYIQFLRHRFECRSCD